MTFFKWLFGRSTSKDETARSPGNRWVVSENGNPMLIEGAIRITVFPQDRGWKFCIADVDDREEPYFSESLSSAGDAKEEALAHLRGEPSIYDPLSAAYAENRRDRWEAHIRDRALLIEEIQRLLTENPDLGITALRKPEARVASHLKQLEWQIAEYHRADVSADLIAQAERQMPALVKSC